MEWGTRMIKADGHMERICATGSVHARTVVGNHSPVAWSKVLAFLSLILVTRVLAAASDEESDVPMLAILPQEFDIGMNWDLVVNESGWPARSEHTSVVHGGKTWVIGGFGSASTFFNDVWLSADGNAWSSTTLSAPWTARRGHTSVVHDDKIWILGGDSPRGLENDVWRSADGENWSSATLSAPWEGRFGHTTVVFDGKIWVIGGQTLRGTSPDIWSSADGAVWRLVTSSPEWAASSPRPEQSGRSEHTSVVFDDKIWLIGGYQGDQFTDGVQFIPDVWYSADGVLWTQATESAPWAERTQHTSVAYDGKIWILGRRSVPCLCALGRRSDVWFSSDGANWTEATPKAGWSPRGEHTSVVFDEKIWVLGGQSRTGEYWNDVWYSGLPPNRAELWMRYP